MIALMLLLVSEPLAEPPPIRTVDFRSLQRDLDAANGAAANCRNARLQRTDAASPERGGFQPDLTFRRDGEVRGYRLLERSIGGCSLPISFALQPDGSRVIIERY